MAVFIGGIGSVPEDEKYLIQKTKKNLENALRVLGYKVVQYRRGSSNFYRLAIVYIPKLNPQSSFDPNWQEFDLNTKDDKTSINRILRKLGISKKLKLD